MKLAATMAAVLLALAACASPRQGEPRHRNFKEGVFYETFRPESSKQAEVKAKFDRPAAPEIDETYDVSRIRAARQYSEVADDYELRDWKDGVLLRADADLLHRMRDDTAAKVGTLETKLAGMNREPAPLTKGRIEPVRQQLDVEKTKLSAIDDRIAHLE
jgi:hypothetical protein